MDVTYKKKLWIVIPIVLVIILGILLYYFYKNKNSNIIDIETSINIDTSSDDINWDNYEEKNIKLSESLTITNPGVYTLNGTLTGNITINTNANVKLILNNVTITSDNGPAIYVKNADNVIISTMEGTTNTLSDSSTYTGFDDGIEGAIFSKDDLVLEGTGTLILNGNKGDSLVSKDDLLINSGTYIINAKDDGIRGKDSVYIKDGNITITSVCDAIKSTNETDTTKGYVKIDGGTFNITTTSTNESDSAKGIKSSNLILINGGKFNINTTDDAIHSNNNIKINNGNFEIYPKDDGIHADNELIIEDGNIVINKSYEGLEAQNIVINNGVINIFASDDGINATGKTNTTATLTINGGDISVNASGDGLDANGSIYIYGGSVNVDGPTSNGDGALDYDKELIISGGTLVAVGSSGMAQGISNTSTQYGILVNFSNTYNSNDVISIVDSSNKEVFSYTAKKSFSSLCYSSKSLKDGETYTIKINGVSVQVITINNISTTAETSSRNPSGRPNNQGGPRR